MGSLVGALQEVKRRADQAAQKVQNGEVVGYDQGRVRVTVGGITMNVDSGLNDPLKRGDRVMMVAGKGNSTIIGYKGVDEAKL